MKLTSLEIHGFKSFADRTKLHFSEGITGIVGPNGCGKSNVVDAIRWVLGEQRTRHLRSDKMENVLFNGTERRKRAALAEVTLTLENHRGALPAQYSTLALTRKLYRDGESEYLLNDVPCRLKDISALLLDTGIGTDSYAIIELSMVEEMLTDRNNARRQLFEEAAGIAKYKLRKKETFQRLEETQLSLARVEDLLYELDKNLKTLERQAARAEKYLQLKQAYRQVSTELALLRREQLAAEQQALAAALQQQRTEQAAVQAQLAQQEAEAATLQASLLTQEGLLQAQQRELAQQLEKIQGEELEKAVRQTRLQYLEERREVLAGNLSTGQEVHASLATAVAKLAQERDGALQVHQLLMQQLAELTTQLNQAANASAQALEGVNTAAQSLQGQQQLLAAAQRQGEQREYQLQALAGERTRNQQDQQALSLPLQALPAALVEKLQYARAELDLQLAAEVAHKDALAALAHQLSTHREAIYQAQRQLDARQQEYSLLKGLVDSLEGFSESVKFLRLNAGWAAGVPLVSEIISSPEPYRKALEALLEPYLSYFVVPGREAAEAGLRLLQQAGKGRAAFFLLDEVRLWLSLAAPLAPLPPLPFTPICLLTVVQVPTRYQALADYLLGNAWLLPQALPPGLQVPAGITLLTEEGSLIAKPPVLAGGSMGLFDGKRIGRAQYVEGLIPQVEELKNQLAALQQKGLQLQQQQQTLHQQSPAAPLERAKKALELAQREEAAALAHAAQHRQAEARLAERAALLVKEEERLQAELAALQPKLAALAQALPTAQQALEKAQQAAHALGAAQQALQQAHNQQHLQLLEASNKVDSLEKDLSYHQQQLHSYVESRAVLVQEKEALGQEAIQLQLQGQQGEARLVALLARQQTLAHACNTQEAALLTRKHQAQQLDTNLRTARRVVEEAQQRVQALRDKATELTIQQNGLGERLSVEFELDLATLQANEVLSQPLESYDLAAVEAQMHHYRQEVQRFGEVNATAIEAYRELKERHEFITSQRADLLAAQGTLAETLQELDQTARDKFLATFGQIREHFIRVFRTLFTEQDDCDLVLLRPEDPLESPIEIMAKPKGKRPLTITQLSGGEKTLTAISLLFAIYLIKPAPFCIFDEVDAPLDDANVDKFTHIIQEFSAGSQFILVTHNKRTMAQTHVLYGVTMEETGISRVLPVDLVALNLN